MSDKMAGMTRKNFFKALAGMIAGAFVVPEAVKAQSRPILASHITATESQCLWGQQMTWEPAVFTLGWELDQKYQKLKPGTIVPMWTGKYSLDDTDEGLGGIPVRPLSPSPILGGRA